MKILEYTYYCNKDKEREGNKMKDLIYLAIGFDVTLGLALIGMIAVYVSDYMDNHKKK